MIDGGARGRVSGLLQMRRTKPFEIDTLAGVLFAASTGATNEVW
jgi:hypothetical protein